MSILDNLGKRVADTYKTAAKASSEILEETKLRLAMLNEQNKVEELYEKLGEKVFSLYGKGESLGEDFDNQCKEIQALKETINSMKSRIKELRNIKACPKCSIEIDLSYQYCPRCGEKQEMPPPPPEETREVCPDCGTELAKDFDFCPNCGYKKSENQKNSKS